MPDLSGAQGAQPVSLFDETSGNQLSIDSSGRITSTLVANGTTLTATGSSLNVNITGGASSVLTDTDDGSIATGQIPGLQIGLNYGYNGTNWERIKSSANRLIVDGSQVTQPISGTVTSNIGTTNGLALDATFAKLTIAQGTALGSNTLALMGGSVTTSAPTYTTGQISPLSLDTTGALRVNVSSITSGSTEQHTVDSSGDTYTAGTTKGVLADARVVSSVPSLTAGQFSALTLSTGGALRVTDNADGPVSPGTAATSSQLVGAQYNSTSPTLTNTQQAALQLDASGNLYVHVTASPASPPSAGSISDYVTNNKVYVTAFNVNMPTAGTDNPLFYLRNPSGSGKTLYIYKIGLGINVANVFSNFRLFVDPTVTANGTSQTATSLNIGGGAPASSMLPTSTPTITATGTILESWEGGQNTGSISFIEDFSIHIAENHSLLITGNPSSNNREAAITLVWVEL